MSMPSTKNQDFQPAAHGDHARQQALPMSRLQTSTATTSVTAPAMIGLPAPQHDSAQEHWGTYASVGSAHQSPATSLPHTSPEFVTRLIDMAISGQRADIERYISSLISLADAVMMRQEFYQAIGRGDQQQIRRLASADPDLLDLALESGETALMYAVRSGSLNSVTLLLKLCPSGINRKNWIGQTALNYAIAANSVELIDALLQAGASLRTVSQPKKFRTPLHDMVMLCPEAVPSALKYAEAADLKATNYEGSTALHIAAGNDQMACVEDLLKAGADPTLCNDFGDTPLMSAVVGNKLGCTRLLVACINGSLVNIPDKNGFTPLHVAAQRGYADLVTVLMNSGANLDALSKNGDSALSNSIFNAHPEVTRLLVAKGASAWAGAKLINSALWVAARRDDITLETIEILAKANDFNADHEKLYQLLSQAVKRNKCRWLKLAIEHPRLRPDHLSAKQMINLLSQAINTDKTEPLDLVCALLDKTGDKLQMSLSIETGFHIALSRRKWGLLHTIARHLHSLTLTQEDLHEILTSIDQHKNYELLAALTTMRLKDERENMLGIDSHLLSDPVAREVLAAQKTSAFTEMSNLIRKQLRMTHDLDTSTITRELVKGVSSADPESTVKELLGRHQVSGLLAAPIIDSLVALAPALGYSSFSSTTATSSVSSNTASLPKASMEASAYLVSFCLAELAIEQPLPSSALLVGVPKMESALANAEKQRKLLAQAGLRGLETANARLGSVSLSKLAMLAAQAEVKSTSSLQDSLALTFAKEFGLLPLWAQRMAGICVKARNSASLQFGKSFSISLPPEAYLAILETEIKRAFNADIQRPALPEGLRRTSDAIPHTHLEKFNKLIYQQWDRWVEAIAEPELPQVAIPGTHARRGSQMMPRTITKASGAPVTAKTSVTRTDKHPKIPTIAGKRTGTHAGGSMEGSRTSRSLRTTLVRYDTDSSVSTESDETVDES